MPETFLKPLDYSVNLLIKPHPTLRQFFNQHLMSEVDSISVFHYFYFQKVASKISFSLFATNQIPAYKNEICTPDKVPNFMIKAQKPKITGEVDEGYEQSILKSGMPSL